VTTAPNHMKELAHRAADGVEVALYWNRRTDGLTVVVDDARTGDAFELPVESAYALDAFDHPYAYAARAGVAYAAGNREVVYA
jgi:hypothetical protein